MAERETLPPTAEEQWELAQFEKRVREIGAWAATLEHTVETAGLTCEEVP